MHSSSNVVPIPRDGPRDVVLTGPAQVPDAPVELVERGLGGALVLHRFVIVGHSGSFVCVWQVLVSQS